MYWAFKLTEESKKYLLAFLKEQGIEIPEGWTIYCDHCTICHNANVPVDTFRMITTVLQNFGFYDKILRVYAYSMNDNVLAVQVNAGTINNTAHITIAVAPGHRPVESNELTEWNMFRQSYPVNSFLLLNE